VACCPKAFVSFLSFCKNHGGLEQEVTQKTEHIQRIPELVDIIEPAWLIDSTGEVLRRVATVPRIAVGF
jgi:hypothetical protein